MTKNIKKVIKFYGAMWCGDCIRAKSFLNKNGIKYEFHNTDEDKKAIEFVKIINKGNKSIPTIVFPNNSILVEPTDQELARKLGINTN